MHLKYVVWNRNAKKGEIITYNHCNTLPHANI